MTTYDIALMDQDFLSQIPWHYAIIDEAQRLKNPSSVSGHFIYVVLLNSGFDWFLTVTAAFATKHLLVLLLSYTGCTSPRICALCDVFSFDSVVARKLRLSVLFGKRNIFTFERCIGRA